MQVIIKREGKESTAVELPVLPSGFEVPFPYKHQQVDVNATGTVNLIGKPDLRSLSLSSFFPSKYNEGWVGVAPKALLKPYEYVKKIRKLMGKICRVVITGTDVNMLCLIDKFSYSEDDGSGDVSFTLDLTEYRSVEVKRVAKTTTGGVFAFTTKKGDTLKKVAKRMLGSASKAKSIYKANKKTCDKAFKKKSVKAGNKKRAVVNKRFPKGIILVMKS